VPAPEEEEEEETSSSVRRPRSKSARRLNLITVARQPPFALRNLHWLLVFTLIPLGISLTYKSERGENDIEERLSATLANAPPDVQIKAMSVIQKMETGDADLDDLFKVLPEQRLVGAHLARNTWRHWFYALVAAALFMGFLLILASHGSAEPLHLLLIALFTATVGIVFLLLVQLLAEWSQGVWLGGRSIIVLLFYIVKFIGFSYRAASDPSNGFFLSFLGFTLGVGLCEELVKAMPVLWHYRRHTDQSWRGAFLWGLASGAGFGVAEGIMYSSRYYNGLAGPGIYFVRFISCVALHALWSGSVGISVHRRQDMFQENQAWHDFILPIFLMIGVPMFLHGLYDTLLKRGETLQNGFALAVAIASFGWLAFQMALGGQQERAEERRAYLKEYGRRGTARA
jgi:RsiW-degrading membrane proteinase PrsW (M82 family)